MTDPNEPTFPNKDNMGDGPEGLTKREYFAIELTKALISSGITHVHGVGDPEHFSALGNKYAEALIAELNKATV